jgi:hypothetical protein
VGPDHPDADVFRESHKRCFLAFVITQYVIVMLALSFEAEFL